MVDYVTGATLEQVKAQVFEAQDAAILRAIQTRDRALSIMDDMAAFMPNIITQNPAPNPPILSAEINANLVIEPILTSQLGAITTVNRADIALDALLDIPDFVLQPLSVDFTSLTMPPSPAAAPARTSPVKPDTFGEVIVPADFVSGADPSFPMLVEMNLPTFVAPVFPEFTSIPPEFVSTPVSLVLQWAEAEYPYSTITDLTAKLKELWAGGTGIPAEIEAAMWERAASREDTSIARDVSAATIEFAAKGFTMPPGMLAARIDAIRNEGQIKKLGLGREMAIKLTESQIENVRFACTTSIAAENVLIGIWDNEAKRRLEVAKISMESQISFFGAQVNLFNANQAAYAAETTVFKAKLDAATAKLSTYKAQIEGESLKGQVNAQMVQIYTEQFKALSVKADVYKTVMQGAAMQGDVIKGKIEAYKVEVEAFATELNSDKVRFDIYDAQIRGELGKAQLLDTQVKAYAAYLSGEGMKIDMAAKNNQARISKNELLVKEYATNVEKDKALMQAQSAAVSANAEAHKVNMARFTAQAGVEQEGVKLKIQASESAMARSLQLYEIEIKKYSADLEQSLRVSATQLESMKAAGQIASTLAAGAMAGISISSGVQGSASTGYSESTSTSKSTSLSKSFEAVTANEMSF